MGRLSPDALAGLAGSTLTAPVVSTAHFGDSGGESSGWPLRESRRPWAFTFVDKSECRDWRTRWGTPAEMTAHIIPPNIAHAATNPSWPTLEWKTSID